MSSTRPPPRCSERLDASSRLRRSHLLFNSRASARRSASSACRAAAVLCAAISASLGPAGAADPGDNTPALTIESCRAIAVAGSYIAAVQ